MIEIIEDLSTKFDDICREYPEDIVAIYYNDPLFLDYIGYSVLSFLIILKDKNSNNVNKIRTAFNEVKKEYGIMFKLDYLNGRSSLFNKCEELPEENNLYLSHFLNESEPVKGTKLTFNLDLLTLVDVNYVMYLYSNLLLLKSIYSNVKGLLNSGTRAFYPIILTTYILLNGSYTLTSKQQCTTNKVYNNAGLQKDYDKGFEEDFKTLLQKYDIAL